MNWRQINSLHDGPLANVAPGTCLSLVNPSFKGIIPLSRSVGILVVAVCMNLSSCFQKGDTFGNLFLIICVASFFAYLLGSFSKAGENSGKRKGYHYEKDEEDRAGFGCAVRTFVLGMIIFLLVLAFRYLNKC